VIAVLLGHLRTSVNGTKGLVRGECTGQTRHVVRLVNDLLDVARINRGTLEIQREVIELKQCVLAAVDSARSRADAKGLALQIELPERPIYIHADPERISQILDRGPRYGHRP
jgi:signal transduction histidine kinase